MTAERRRNRRRERERDVKNSGEGFARLNICFGRPREGRRCTRPLTCTQRSPSVLTINLNGVGVIILPTPPSLSLPPHPRLNPAFLPDTASYKQSGLFPPLGIGKGDGLSWKNPEASQEPSRSCFLSLSFFPSLSLSLPHKAQQWISTSASGCSFSLCDREETELDVSFTRRRQSPSGRNVS